MSQPAETQKGLLSYAADFAYGAMKYPSGWEKRAVVQGYFAESENGRLQQIFFDALLQQQFKRTAWQLVFPGQTAGLVRKQKTSACEPNEHHVRFYDDGGIECELEYDRFQRLHWAGKREDGTQFLREFLDVHLNICSMTKEQISALFTRKQYSEQCIRKGRTSVAELLRFLLQRGVTSSQSATSL